MPQNKDGIKILTGF